MLYREISRIIGYFLFIFAGILLAPLSIAIYHQFFQDPIHHPQGFATLAFLETIFICLALGAVLYFCGRKTEGKIYRREGIVIVVAIWILTSLVGCLPFYLSGTLQNPIQAFFEAMSGFTTTGSTVMEAKLYDIDGTEVPITGSYLGLEKVEYSYFGTIEPIRDENGKVVLDGIDAVSRSIIFWRSLIQWLGGLGIMVLFVAILPALGVGGKVLLQSEVTGPIKSSMTPRVKETAIQLWKIYVFLTLLEIGLLYATNVKMSLFDAINLSFTNLSTGGFTPHNSSIEYWDSYVTDWIVIVFMVIGSINFSLYYFCLKGKLYKLWDPELIVFLLVVISISLFATYQLYGMPRGLLNGLEDGTYTLLQSFSDGTFQLIAALTSTGYYTANYDLWPYETQVLMLMAMFIGGMSGSTAGGIKIIRHIILVLLTKARIISYYRPEAIQSLKINNREIDYGTAINVFSFFFLIISISVLGTFLYSVDGIDPETSIGLTGCMVNNVGIAFRQAGVMNSCAFLSNFSLLLSCLLMLLGRLEFIVVLVMLVPAFWMKER